MNTISGKSYSTFLTRGLPIKNDLLVVRSALGKTPSANQEFLRDRRAVHHLKEWLPLVPRNPVPPLLQNALMNCNSCWNASASRNHRVSGNGLRSSNLTDSRTERFPTSFGFHCVQPSANCA